VGTVTLTKRPESISTFRGFDLNRRQFETHEFVVQSLLQLLRHERDYVEGRKTYWGDKCSDKFPQNARGTSGGRD